LVTVYALSNTINAEIYIGMTTDIVRRIKEHNSGANRYTKAYKPWKIFYTEILEDYSSARIREKYFKTTKGRREQRTRLDEFNLLNKE
jgi:putative endonuclease